MFRVTSEDPRLLPYHPLQHRAQRAHSDWIWAEGQLAVERLLKSEFPVHSILGTPAKFERLSSLIPAEVPYLAADREMLSSILGYDLHRGCVGCAPRPALWPATPQDSTQRVVAVERIGDPANLGAVIRNCRAFRVDRLLIGPHSADPFAPRAIRAAMGNTFSIPMATPPDLLAAVSRWKQAQQLTVLATTPHPSATPLSTATLPDRFLLLLGHEGAGLSDELIALADLQLRIPIQEHADSLNVAAASAVLLYALTG